MNISKIKVGSTTYNLKDPNAISLNTISSWAQAGNSDTIPSSKLPSYVDDVLEYASTSSFPETGESGKIYVATDTNKTYRWGGSSYVVISETIAIGTTQGTAYDGAAGAALKSKLDGIEAGAQTHRAPSAAEVKTALGTGSGTSKYLREDGTWATPPDTNTWPTATSQLTNDSGYITGITKSMVTSALGYTPPSSDTNTVTSINGKTGAIAAADMAAVLTAAGYALTDTNTWPSYTSQLTNDSGYITSSGSCNYANSAGSAPANGGTATAAHYLSTYQANNGNSLIDVLKNKFNDIPKSVGTAVRLELGSHSMGFGWFLDGYGLQNAYGGWFVSQYGTPSWVGVDNGTWKQENFITSGNIGGQSVNYANSAGSVAWGNVSGRPTAVSSFTNDSGYITSSGSCNYANSAGSASSASGAGYANQLQAFTGDNFTGGDHFVKAIRSSDGWSTRLWMCYNGGAAQSNAVQVSYADSAGYASSAGSAPASDVYSWAKLSSKPSYSYGEISGRPTKLSDLTNDVGYITSYTDTNTWRPITNTYTGSDQGTSVSQYGTNALYNALVNGYASSAGNADTLDGYHYNNLPYLTSHLDISGKVDKTSGSRPGVYRLYRRDDDSAYNVQTSWDGSRWLLRGYYGDDYHAPCRTEYADYAASAGSAPASDVYSWAKQSSKPSYSYSEISGTPGSLPASDVYAWAKASSKPGYSYGEIGYSTWTGTTSGALSLDLGTYPLYCVTLNGNVSSVSISGAPAAGHSGHVIFYNSGSSNYTVNIAHGSGSIKCPEAKDIALTVKAGGYAEIDILHVAGVAYFVRGV